MNKLSRVGIDLAKNVYQLHGVDRSEQALWRRRLTRGKWLKVLLSNVEPGCEIGMEACAGAHHWARLAKQAGHRVRILPALSVAPYRQGHKTDRNNALAVAEAAVRPHIKEAPLKSLEQQGLQAIQRSRELLIRDRTALSNHIRGLLLEFGIAIPKGFSHLHQAVPEILEDAEMSRICSGQPCA
jgi:transposase